MSNIAEMLSIDALFDLDQEGEFIEQLEEHGVEYTAEEGEIAAYSAAGVLIAHFSATPTHVAAGGWIRFGYYE